MTARKVLDQTRQDAGAYGYGTIVKKIFGMMKRFLSPMTDEKISSGDNRQHLRKVLAARRRPGELCNAAVAHDMACGLKHFPASVRIIHRDAENLLKFEVRADVEGRRATLDYPAHVRYYGIPHRIGEEPHAAGHVEGGRYHVIGMAAADTRDRDDGRDVGGRADAGGDRRGGADLTPVGVTADLRKPPGPDGSGIPHG